jgi:NAD(P)H-dependent FMN reductase
MKALVLDGAAALPGLAGEVATALRAELTARGHDVVRRDLAGLQIPPCNGDFGCWFVTPGRCVQPGAHRELLTEVVRSDLVVWLTTVTFGGYSADLKRALDHFIPSASALMARFDGETHHPARYPRVPALLVVGLTDRPDPDAAAVFHRLARRNALNLHVPRFASAIAGPAELTGMSRWVDAALGELAASTPPRAAATPLELGPPRDLPAVAPRRAVVLSGSPRGAGSVSGALAADLASALAARGVAATRAELHVELRRDPELRQVSSELGAADLVALVAPLYVDALPAPVTRSLELLAPALARRDTPARFLGIVQCGFPEAVHTDTALGICRCFAAQAHLDWIGGLGIGGGGMLRPTPLAEQGGRARAFARALELTADAVARGSVVPAEAQRLVRSLPIPAWLYRRFADLGFLLEAKRHGVLLQLGAQPDR